MTTTRHLPMPLAPGMPPAQGLYDPSAERDACGIGFVARIDGKPSRELVDQGLEILSRLRHRGAQGADPLTSDGAGILTQVPHDFLARECHQAGFKLPGKGKYGVAQVFLPRDKAERDRLEHGVVDAAIHSGLQWLGWRDVPVDPAVVGPQARLTEPVIRQGFAAPLETPPGAPSESFTLALERRLFVARKRAERAAYDSPGAGSAHFFVCSFSSRTLIYKGLVLPERLADYYPDLRQPGYATAISLVHSRFSTNTFPTWRLAHPYRMLCHNGEINTIRGNVNWMRARQGRLASDIFGVPVHELYPIVREGQSDSASLDNALEFLVLGGRSLPHSMMMLIPEPWVANPHMDLDRRGFYEFQSAMMEPWDGPAAVCFTDGRWVGATLDRNGLRPCRYAITRDGRVIVASEAGVLPLDPTEVRVKGRLTPGRMLLIDTAKGRLIDDEEIKSSIAKAKPYRAWVTQHKVSLEELPEPLNVPQPDHLTLRARQQAFGYTIEELVRVLMPMAVDGEEPLSSMGADTPMAALSERPQLLFRYFRQLFAQVTNPPIDPIREQLVMSLATNIGPKPNLLGEAPEDWRRITVRSPVLTNAELQKIRELADPDFRSKTLDMVFRAADGPEGLRAGVIRLCRQATRAIRDGYRFLILSDRGVDAEWAPIPSLLGIAAVHHHLVRKSIRAEVGLIVESGEPRDVHQFACLLGYGAGSVNPYLAFETLNDLARDNYLPAGVDAETARTKYVKAVEKGLLKILSKMGISTVQSYCGAQVFEALGLGRDLIRRYFAGTPSRIGGGGLAEIGRESLERHHRAYSYAPVPTLEEGGDIHYRADGEHHLWNPETIALLQNAARSGDAASYRDFSERANGEASRSTLRGLLELDFSGGTAVPVDEVEPAAEIVKRFTTGAMSYGALGKEAHETLAVAMNRIGGKSNTGEGGEDPERARALANGDSRNSAIKQVASARFGVTAAYLASAVELQIKMAQGAKPGEGGQLPGHKVDEVIARLRFAMPGVTLISPPPHHDIYSIEDLKELIFDLKNANPEAAVSVKLVAEMGVGTVAAGVVKAKADKILISGDTGGTGASPLSSIQYAGLPWELGLAETHQTLVLNGLRSRVRLETDGGMRTGRDVIVAALLGAEEFGFATAPLVAQGCILMRKCHLNTCPVGIATQDPELRKRFTGQPEHVIRYLFFVADEARELMARLGYRKMDELIGHAQRLRASDLSGHGKGKHLDLAAILRVPREATRSPRRWTEPQNHGLEKVLDHELILRCAPALERSEPVRFDSPIANSDRATGTMLSGRIAKSRGGEGLPDATIRIDFRGSAGQSFGAFLARGVTLTVEGETNDYVGKGLSGGRIVVTPPPNAAYPSGESVLIGNTVLYGATSGEAYFAGIAGERFAVRNSGARAVVEGTGDHGCEYMTGGLVVVLGRTGRNFAAGMSGGIAFVLDEDGTFSSRCNLAMVEVGALTGDEEREALRAMLQAHARWTSSGKARRLLENWPRSLELFKKVMPVDYRRALAERKIAIAPPLREALAMVGLTAKPPTLPRGKEVAHG